MKEDRSDYTHNFSVNDRVRFRSDNPEHEPVGTIIETGYCSVKIGWDDEHSPSLVTSSRVNQIERV